MTEIKSNKESLFAGYALEQSYRNSPDWVASGYDADGFETPLFTVNSEGVARGNLYKITGDPGWLVLSGKKERRLLANSSVTKALIKEMDQAVESIATAREGMENNPDDLEWPGIEEGSIDGLRALMRVAEAAGLDVSTYETAITGDANVSDKPIIDRETGLQIGP